MLDIRYQTVETEQRDRIESKTKKVRQKFWPVKWNFFLKGH